MKAKPNNARNVNVSRMEPLYEDMADLKEVLGEMMKMDDNDAYARPSWMHY